MANTTPVVRCPRCEHPINSHVATKPVAECIQPGCSCHIAPNEIAVALLYGGLTPTAATAPRTWS